jgi:hypothetical protein
MPRTFHSDSRSENMPYRKQIKKADRGRFSKLEKKKWAGEKLVNVRPNFSS